MCFVVLLACQLLVSCLLAHKERNFKHEHYYLNYLKEIRVIDGTWNASSHFNILQQPLRVCTCQQNRIMGVRLKRLLEKCNLILMRSPFIAQRGEVVGLSLIKCKQFWDVKWPRPIYLVPKWPHMVNLWENCSRYQNNFNGQVLRDWVSNDTKLSTTTSPLSPHLWVEIVRKRTKNTILHFQMT